MRVRRACAAVVGTLLVLGLTMVGQAGTAAAVTPTSEPHDRIVSADPVDFTPQVQDGAIKTIVKVGNRILVGGSFTSVKEVGGNKPVLTRNRLFAFDATTGAIDPTWVPDVDKDEVSVLLPAPDGQSVYVGGGFNAVNGTSAFKLTRLDLVTGAPISTFRPRVDARVKDLRLAGGRLWVSGNFATVDGVPRAAVATLDPTTGALTDYSTLVFSGNQTGDASVTQGYKMDTSPDGSKLVVVGNFNAVNGQVRRQIVMIDLTGPQAALANWDTIRYADQCSQSFDTYMRDVAFSPDGSYFVVTTTGGYGGTTRLCDTQARWESALLGAGRQPTWINSTGGDTSYAVEITSAAVYVGGHFRWANNPFRGDRADQGAVAREGIAALDPANGLPFSWNPGRIRGVGVFDMLATSEGLWIGSDTDEAGGEFHPKLAMFPVAGGTAAPVYNTGALPGDIYSGGGSGIGAQNYLRRRTFDGTTAGTSVDNSTLGVDWRTVRGAFMIDGELFYGTSDGRFSRRTFDGTTLGTPMEINTGDQLVTMSTWHGAVPSINGMFFAGGRLYYTRGTASALYYRYFTPESNVVGAQEFTAVGNLPGVSWSSVGGMFVSGGRLYYVSTSDGRLSSIAFTGGVPTGSPTVVSTADWRGRAVFLYRGVPNVPPTASVVATGCTDLSCSFTGAGSTDPDGTIASYAWDFGDGTTDSVVAPSHAYAQAGTYTVTLTVTDNRGGQATASQEITVAVNQAPVAFRGAAGFNGNVAAATVTVPAETQAGDGMIAVLTQNSTTATVTPPAGWTLVDTQSTSGTTSTLYRRVAAAGDAGQTATFTLSAINKVDVRMVVYSGTSPSDPIAAVSRAADATTVTAHPSPTAVVAGTGTWAVTFWADKSSTTTAWTAPAGVAARSTGVGTGSGRVTSLVVDSGAPVPTGSYGGLVASTDAASRALSWTVVLARTG
ncbi:MAG: PKD domain-containing protein [Pseudonocardiales bacterium]|nr:PKD domain-containing protein [Pseudonocardiales bacterium]